MQEEDQSLVCVVVLLLQVLGLQWSSFGDTQFQQGFLWDMKKHGKHIADKRNKQTKAQHNMGSKCFYWSTQPHVWTASAPYSLKIKKIYRRSVLIKVCSRLSWISTMLATDLLLLLICSCSSIIGTCQEIGKMLWWNCYLKKFHEKKKYFKVVVFLIPNIQ